MAYLLLWSYFCIRLFPGLEGNFFVSFSIFDFSGEIVGFLVSSFLSIFSGKDGVGLLTSFGGNDGTGLTSGFGTGVLSDFVAVIPFNLAPIVELLYN